MLAYNFAAVAIKLAILVLVALQQTAYHATQLLLDNYLQLVAFVSKDIIKPQQLSSSALPVILLA